MAKHVKFISYTEGFPNLCRGVLTLEIDGEVYRFNRYTDRFGILVGMLILMKTTEKL